MLRLLHKRLRTRLIIALCPAQVAIVESTRDRKRQSRKLAMLSCDEPLGEAAWSTSLAALRQWLEQNRQAKADVEVVISDDLARYALIPWSDKVQNSAEMALLARIQFESLFGAAVSQWDIQTDWSTYGGNGIGCAIDQGLIAELRELLAVHQLRLASLQPYFVRAFNRWRNQISRSDALFAVVGEKHCVLAGCKEGRWHSIRSFRVGEQMNAEVPVLIQREIVLQGLDEKSAIYLHAVASIDSAQWKQDIGATILACPASAGEEAAALQMILSEAG